MSEHIFIKGKRNGLELVFDQSIDFEVIYNQLKNKLAAATAFFNEEAAMHVRCDRNLTEEQKNKLVSLLANYGLKYDEQHMNKDNNGSCSISSAQEVIFEIQKNKTLILNKTLRNGQKIEYEGSIVIIGDVNPGAQVIAGGNIHIIGTCRGTAHAGAQGDKSATITATRLIASQLRIASLITRAPDNLIESQTAETARILRDTVVIQPANC